MKSLSMLLFAVLLSLSSVGFAQSFANPDLKSMAIDRVYIPIGFDSNDNSQVVIEGMFPNGCYRLGPSKVQINRDTHVIAITQQAYRYPGPCVEMLVPFDNVIDLGILAPSSDYKIVDAVTGKQLGKLQVKRATNSGPDDFLYAPVSEATVRPGAVGGYFLLIDGAFLNSCASFREIKIDVQPGDVIVALPLADMASGPNCKVGYFPFHKHLLLPELPAGRRLIHVRSLNGRSVNRLFDFGGQ